MRNGVRLQSTKHAAEVVQLFRIIVTTISGFPVLLKTLWDKQGNPHLSFQFEVPASMEEESDEDLDEWNTAST